jgi:hypothetical protein
MRNFRTKSRLTRKVKPKKSNRGTAKRRRNQRNKFTIRLRKALQNQRNRRTTGGGKWSEYFTDPQKMLALTRLKRIHNSIVNAANRYNEQASILKNKNENFPPFYPEEIKSGTTIMFYSNGTIDVNAPVTEFRAVVNDTESVGDDSVKL